jgi:hypothetical protein
MFDGKKMSKMQECFFNGYSSCISLGRILVSILMIIFYACSSTDSVKPSDERYFPLTVGAFWVYDVEETSILRTACSDNGETISKYELRLLVVDSFPNSEQGIAYSIQRSTRLNASQPWQPEATWTSKISKSQAINNESNISYIKLVFPFFEGQQWNGNLLNAEQQLNGLVEDAYKITLARKSYTTSLGKSFDKTVTVLQSDEQKNILYRDTRSEVYAFDVGLVYKESYLLEYFANSQLPCYAQNRTQQGSILKQTLKEWGRN